MRRPCPHPWGCGSPLNVKRLPYGQAPQETQNDGGRLRPNRADAHAVADPIVRACMWFDIFGIIIGLPRAGPKPLRAAESGAAAGGGVAAMECGRLMMN